MAKIDYNSWKQYSSKQNNDNNGGSKIGFLQLKNDGDYAIVRFLDVDPATYDIGALHTLGKENKYRRISCPRNPFDPMDKCPLCENGEKVLMKMYVKLINYVDENGEIVEKPCLWERPAGFAKKLNSLIDEYGDISECLFKVVRNGSGLDTTYEILYAPANKYPNEKYPMESKSVFDGYSAFGKLVKEYTFEQLNDLVHGKTIDQINAEIYGNKEEKVEQEKPIETESVKQSAPPVEEYKPEPAYRESSFQGSETRQRKPWEVPTQEDNNPQVTPRRRYY